MTTQVPYTAVNRVTRDGNSYEPGDTIYLDPNGQDAKDLLDIKAIKEPGTVLPEPTTNTSGSDKLAQVSVQLADALNANKALQTKLDTANQVSSQAINENTALNAQLELAHANLAAANGKAVDLQAQLDQAKADLAAAKAAAPAAPTVADSSSQTTVPGASTAPAADLAASTSATQPDATSAKTSAKTSK